MFKLFKKAYEPTSWKNYKQKEEIIDGELVITINEESKIEDLNKSIVDYMSGNGMSYKYRVVVSKVEEV